MSNVQTLCIVCSVFRSTGKPRRPDFPPVCGTCRERVKAELAEIPDLYALIPAALEPGTGTGVKVSGTRNPPLPVALNPLNLLTPARSPDDPQIPRGAVYDPFSDQHGPVSPLVVLDQWVADWINVRDRSEHLPVPTMSTLTGWLLNRLDWALDYHPAVDEFAREVHLTLKAIRAVTQPRPTGEPVGRCPAVLNNDTRCNTKLYADPYLDQIQCQRCGSTWARRQWLSLAAAQDDGRDQGAAA